jgi:hypothetical protein
LIFVTDRNSATEEAGSTPVSTSVALIETKQSYRTFLAPAKRTLSEDELAVPGVRRYLIEDMERLDARCAELQTVADKYYELRVENAVLAAKLTTSKWHEALSGLCLAIGSAGLGISIKILSVDATRDVGMAVMILSALLVLAGIASKVFK